MKILLHEVKFAREHVIARRNKLHEDNFAQRVNFARVTILHESKINKKNLKDILIKKSY